LRARELGVAGLGLALVLSLGQALAEQTSEQKDTGQNPAPQTAPQAAPQTAPATADKDKPADKDKKDKKDQNATGKAPPPGTSNDRLAGLLPNFLTLETGAKLPPLTVKQKFGVVARGSFDPVQYPWWALLSGLDQAAKSDPALGQGWEGYGKRYGIVAADGTIENFMVAAVLPTLLHQDPRFFQSSQGGFLHRTGYAVTRIVITRGDSGRTQFNFSEIIGAGLAAAISTYSYHPESTFISTPSNPHLFVPSDRTFLNTCSVWGTQVSLDTMTIFIKEFWPDLRRAIRKKKN
jgi:hypothetical protein